jgi:hypothetical protein
MPLRMDTFTKRFISAPKQKKRRRRAAFLLHQQEIMTDHSTTICHHDGCGKRFPLSRYGNRTSTSEKTRKGRHRFCSLKCRVAHHRRMAALKGGVTAPSAKDGVTAPGGTKGKGGVTSLKITQQNQRPLPLQKTTEQPHSGRPSRHPKAIPDAVYPDMWRVQWPDGRVSDMANLSRINDAIAEAS